MEVNSGWRCEVKRSFFRPDFLNRLTYRIVIKELLGRENTQLIIFYLYKLAGAYCCHNIRSFRFRCNSPCTGRYTPGFPFLAIYRLHFFTDFLIFISQTQLPKFPRLHFFIDFLIFISQTQLPKFLGGWGKYMFSHRDISLCISISFFHDCHNFFLSSTVC
jgi:hypothetical protein